ncbi:MAG: hypothetical protein H6668_10395 [Ardenticatenaceae bacterium]|nr:hypothetical protein [Ardenticatenaceae bacterium]
MARWQTLLTQHPWLRRLAEWGFLLLLLAICCYAAARKRPSLSCCSFYVITIHFSLPARLAAWG